MTVPVNKTWKLFVGGKFPRSESGRSYQPAAAKDRNVARASRKDLRDAVVAARAALPGWSRSTAYLRGQILYRLAEMLESHRAAMQHELRHAGSTARQAQREVDHAVALCTWHAGLPDKLPSLLGSQNAVAGPFFNFTTVEPCGVVGVLARERPALLGLLVALLPVLAGGNTAVALLSEPAPCPGLLLGELLATSDVPPGTVNLLAGQGHELRPQFASHRDIDGLFVVGKPDPALGAAAADSTKRLRHLELPDAAFADATQLRSLWWVEPFVESKTLWHPVAP